MMECDYCDRCQKHFCITCIDMFEERYSSLCDTDSLDLIWMCTECKQPALIAIQNDKEIEDRCTDFLKTFENRMERLEHQIEMKADKVKVDSMAEDMTTMRIRMEWINQYCISNQSHYGPLSFFNSTLPCYNVIYIFIVKYCGNKVYSTILYTVSVALRSPLTESLELMAGSWWLRG